MDKTLTTVPKWLRATSIALLISLTVVVAGLVTLLYVGNPHEYRYVNTSKFQAVFLANDQVYFGKIKALTSQYVDLEDVFYLNNQSSQTSGTNSTAPTNLALVKLGCEVHGPDDQMVINRTQVEFWENLSNSGQVVKAIKTWQQQNPNGQQCTSTTNSTNQATSGNNSPSSSSTSSSTSSTTTNATKK